MSEATGSGDCDHTCPRDCEAINKILLKEAVIEEFYLRLVRDCDYPDVRAFAFELLEARKQNLRKFEEAVNRLYSSFNPAGC